MTRRRHRLAAAMCVCLLAAGSARAQAENGRPEASDAPLPEPPGGAREDGLISLRDDAAQFRYTSRFLFHHLTHPSSRPKLYWTLGAILGAAAVLEHEKRPVQSELLEESGRLGEEGNEVSGAGKRLGEGGLVPGIGVLLYFGGLAFQQPRLHDTGQMVLESALYTGLFTGVGQYVLAEERPFRGGDLRFFHWRGHGVSGHASLAASIAAPLSRGLFRIGAGDGRWERFGKRFGTTLSYGWPVLTGLSRIHDNQHFAWNVLLGLSLGYAVGDTVADAHDARRETSAWRWRPDAVAPLLTDRGTGLALAWRF